MSRTKRGRGFTVKFPVEVEREVQREAKRRGLTITGWFLDALLNGALTYSRTRPGTSSVRENAVQETPVEP